MIKEIFIVDDNDKVLYGDPSKFPKRAIYPMNEVNGLQMTQLRINDVRIAVLYGFLDKFSMLSYVQK